VKRYYTELLNCFFRMFDACKLLYGTFARLECWHPLHNSGVIYVVRRTTCIHCCTAQEKTGIMTRQHARERANEKGQLFVDLSKTGGTWGGTASHMHASLQVAGTWPQLCRSRKTHLFTIGWISRESHLGEEFCQAQPLRIHDSLTPWCVRGCMYMGRVLFYKIDEP
jgi:hypothetical protein